MQIHKQLLDRQIVFETELYKITTESDQSITIIYQRINGMLSVILPCSPAGPAGPLYPPVAPLHMMLLVAV